MLIHRFTVLVIHQVPGTGYARCYMKVSKNIESWENSHDEKSAKSYPAEPAPSSLLPITAHFVFLSFSSAEPQRGSRQNCAGGKQNKV